MRKNRGKNQHATTYHATGINSSPSKIEMPRLYAKLGYARKLIPLKKLAAMLSPTSSDPRGREKPPELVK